MRYRKLDANGDRIWGHSQADFWINSPDGVRQSVQTRLGLWLGQWFLNPQDGTPYQYDVLGKYTDAVRDAVIQARVLQTFGVKAIKNYSSGLDRNTRVFKVNGNIDTIYGVTPFATFIQALISVFKGR